MSEKKARMLRKMAEAKVYAEVGVTVTELKQEYLDTPRNCRAGFVGVKTFRSKLKLAKKRKRILDRERKHSDEEINHAENP